MAAATLTDERRRYEIGETLRALRLRKKLGLHVPLYVTGAAQPALGGVGRGERPLESRRARQREDRQGLIESLANAPGRTGYSFSRRFAKSVSSRVAVFTLVAR